MRRIITTTVVSFGALLGVIAFSATPAMANSAWWHLLSGSRPSYLHPLAEKIPPTPGANNRQVAAGAGASEPQISRLIARLAEHGLVENRGGGRGSHAKAWWLTPRGAEFLGKGEHQRQAA